MIDVKRKPDENEQEYLWRIGQAIRNGEIESWRSITPVINQEWRSDISEYRDESAYRKPVKYAELFYDNVFSKDIGGDEYRKQIAREKRELYKERIKLQTEKVEYNRWLRENARDELLLEKFTEAIEAVKPFVPPVRLPKVQNEKAYVLLFGDEHDGVEFQIKGLMGEIINEYNPDILECRMWELLDEVLKYVEKEKINTLNVFEMGDYAEGVLRVGQLMRLRYGVVDSTAHYEEMLATWLYELTRYVHVNFQMVYGNHSELRFFNQPNGSFGDENMGKLVVAYIKQRMAGNPNFTYIENPTGLIFANLVGYNFLGIHGAVKDMKKSLEDFSLFYKVSIDYLAGGHLHHSASEEIAVDQEVIRVPSVMGIDPFSKSLIRSANAGAKILCFERGYGITDEHRIKLGRGEK